MKKQEAGESHTETVPHSGTVSRGTARILGLQPKEHVNTSGRAPDPDTGETVWKKNCWTGNSAETEILCPTVPDGATHVYRVAATDGHGLYDDKGPDFFHTTGVSVTLPDTRPPGWTSTEIHKGQYPELSVDCSESSGLGDCSLLTDYRVERWDPAQDAWTTLTTAQVGDRGSYRDTSVHEDRLGLYYYRVVYTDASGAEVAHRAEAHGIWNSWL
ncbi:hypothetical protein [Streptomyces sp. NPDC001020]